MAEKIVSPGVFTRERDLSFLPAGIAQIGAAIIGPTVKGPAFEPVIIESFKEFEQVFGPKTLDSYVPYTVEGYLKSAGRVTVVRTLGLGGYTPELIGITLAGANGVVAVAKITFTGQPQDDTISLDITDAAGTLKNYIAASSEILAANKFTRNDSDVAVIAASLRDCINNASGHNGTLTAAAAAGVVTITNTAVGVAGNTTIAVTAANNSTGATMSNTTLTQQFTGGVDHDLLDSANNEVVAVLHPTQVDPDAKFASALTTATSNCAIQLKNDDYTSTTVFASGQTLDATHGHTYSGSIDTTAENWLGNVFGTTPKSRIQPVYNYMLFKNYASRSFSDDSTLTTAITDSVSNAFATNYAQKDAYEARTPWIVSQDQGTYLSTSTTKLFKFHTRSHGTSTNYQYKVAILNIKAAGSVPGSDYGSFSVQIRRVDIDGSIHAGNSPYAASGDRDLSPHVVEQWNALTLDPNSPNFIARVIGDRYQKIDTEGKLTVYGDYPNLSRHVWVEVPEEVKDQGTSPDLVPFGFEALVQPIVEAVGFMPTASFVGHTNTSVERTAGGTATSHNLKKTQVADNVYNKKIYYGFDYTDTDNYNYLLPLPSSATSVGNNKHFNLSHCSQHP